MSWTFALVTPDALLCHRAQYLLREIERSGYKILAAQLIGLNVDLMHRMYLHSDDLPHRTGDAPVPPGLDELPSVVMGQLYEQAPGLVLILSGSDGDAAERFLAVKGDKRPVQSGHRTLRFLGEHLLFNFLHSPDDESSALAELHYLLGSDETVCLRSWPRLGRRSSPMTDACILSALPSFGDHTALSFPLIANRVRLRVLQRASIFELDKTSELADQMARLGRRLVEESQRMSSCEQAVERLRLAAEANESIDRCLSGITDQVGLPLSDGLTALSDLLRPERPRGANKVLGLREHGIYISPLEQLAIEAHEAALAADEDPGPSSQNLPLTPMLGALP